jgi:hypothetical protein
MHLFGHTFDHDYYFELRRKQGAGGPINYSVFNCAPSPVPGCPACEPNFVNCPYFHPLHHIQYMRTASLRAMATLAIFRPRRNTRWKYLLRHSWSLRTVTCANSSSAQGFSIPKWRTVGIRGGQ